ncbi:cytochrome P450 [Streptomyces sp. NPDC059740]|uniref:cytochrome P450 n=1 Tax=Streptomyces sp. NPDC059740 TaxID=3346926 RepID=UPI00365BEF1A
MTLGQAGGSAAVPLRFGRAPGSLPGVGHLPVMARRPLQLLGEAARHGDLVEIRLGRRPVHLVCHPRLVRAVLTDDRLFDRDGPLYERSRAALGNGLATCPYADHRRQRRLLQPAFRADHMERYAAAMRRTIGEATHSWQSGGTVDLMASLFALSATTTVRALFGAGLDPSDQRELQHCLDVFLRGVYWRALLPWAARLPTGGNRRYAAAITRWREHADRLLRDRRAVVQQLAGDGSPGAAHNALDHLLTARSADGSPLADAEIHEQATTLVLAGAETTAAALGWAFHLVAGHPGIDARLHAEARSVLGERTAGPEDLPRLPFTRQVVTETLRLCPPAWVIPRTTTRETTLAGRHLPAGSTLVFSPYVVHRRADLYAEPLAFAPDRWAADREAHEREVAARTVAGEFVPFGLGAHRCVGEAFALTEAVLTLASVLARWRPTAVPGTQAGPAARSVLAPRSLPMRLLAR